MNKQKLNIPKTTTAFLFFMLLLGCVSKRSISTNANNIETSPKIIFLNYAIKKTSDGNRSIRFINKKVTEGKLKNHYSRSLESAASGDLQLFQLDKKSNILQSIIIKNPLAKTIEYVNESKSLQSHSIDLDSTRFSCRLQLNPNTKYVSIHGLNTTKNQSIPLNKTKLN
ncbi:hypothetical protein [Flavivirga algicola]|uniref:DUF4251 domain-containing protein n=1 Tax=Flavivirga algicola TaxID=2729136 RepID=A0ABX1RYM2_9FLAO|nr:hypothetical protein [Flavivirga algicola]NMH87753.1 hypothetical protein [Flavivirga algicola]